MVLIASYFSHEQDQRRGFEILDELMSIAEDITEAAGMVQNSEEVCWLRTMFIF